MSFQFPSFRDELDAYYDTRERLQKISRDITTSSKRIIFLLHRLAQEEGPSSDANAASQAKEPLAQVQAVYASIAPDLADDRFHRYERQVSPGLQEYIEALSFAHYLEKRTLITFDEVQKTLCDSDGNSYFPLTISDYLLGLSDLTGELMRKVHFIPFHSSLPNSASYRYAISGIARGGGRTRAKEVCEFVRSIKSDFELFTPHMRGLRAKQAVTAQSLQKIEDATYTIVVRSSEFDIPPDRLQDIVSQTVSSISEKSGRRPWKGREDFDEDPGDADDVIDY